jgi:hypothetical protein
MQRDYTQTGVTPEERTDNVRGQFRILSEQVLVTSDVKFRMRRFSLACCPSRKINMR